MALKSAFTLLLLVAVMSNGVIPCKISCKIECYRLLMCTEAGECAVLLTCRRSCALVPNSCKRKRSITDQDGRGIIDLPTPHGFEYYDADQDGLITLKEFARILKATQQDVQRCFDVLDADRDGQVTRNEFNRMPVQEFN